MGEAFKLECDACRYKDNMFVGIGFAYMSLKSIASFVKDCKLKQRIEQFMEDDSVTYNAYDAVFVCPLCRGIQNELYIEMQSDTSQYKHACHCKRCGALMEEANFEHNNVQTAVKAS
ncbi:hypothetical protein [Marinicrinis lubricantis]|uniref:Uncharacterized protein n=1 Tax=Marinicrinis lubricantis TaxID=2086470 RepID=A0ABW1ISP7_9BACL